ncbi:MAG: saccharopine dehydrogenase NADP-binding domain-containing protein [Acidiferrobacteraceae bacterium]
MATEGRSAREFDVVVWGASAFVGKLVVEYLLETYRVGKDLRWAIAGRNRDKLEAVLREVGQKPDAVPIVLADSHDKSSLKQLARRTKVVCTLVGPFALYGSARASAGFTSSTPAASTPFLLI